MRAESHEHRVASIALTHELAHVPLALLAHFRRRSVAQVRVVRPDRNARRSRYSTREMRLERLHRLDHVPIAQIPR